MYVVQNALIFPIRKRTHFLKYNTTFNYPSTLVRKKSGILYEKNRAFKAVSRHGGGTTITDSVAQRRLVIICNLNRRETKVLTGFYQAKGDNILMRF